MTGYSLQNDNKSCNFYCNLKIFWILCRNSKNVYFYVSFIASKKWFITFIGFSQDTIFEVDVNIHFSYTCTYHFGDTPLMMRNSQIFITGIHQLLAQIFAICIKLLTSGINFLLLNDNLLHNIHVLCLHILEVTTLLSYGWFLFLVYICSWRFIFST